MKICIIGAGAAGLASARHVIDKKYKCECVIFEQTGEIGGTWVYTDRIGVDDFGVPIHTSMYKNLRTNLPKEIMGFPDFQIPPCDTSYVTQEQILKFLNDYADYFNVRNLIKFYHRVKSVEPEGDTWKVTVTDLRNNKEELFNFDAVMICNGHYHTPSIPKIPGNELFKGVQRHSHDFRDINDFSDKKVLVIGAGPSGMDIALQISRTAKEVILSHHSKEEIKTIFPSNFKQKPDVASITENEIIFTDNSSTAIDVIMYCTGYLYNFPFLNEKSGITVDDNLVKPLYKHLININHTKMCFIGLPFYVCAFSMFDLQARFFLEYLTKKFDLPSKEDMLKEQEEEMNQLFLEGFSKKHAHMMGPKQERYYEELSSLANITPIPPVMTKLHNASSKKFVEDLLNFREDVFRILNDHEFVKIN